MVRVSESTRNWLGKLALQYNESLTEEVRTYLESRGINREAQDGFHLGLVAEPDPIHEPYLGRLAIPFWTPSGCVALRFRCLEDHNCKDAKHGKYESISGDETRLYNVQAVHDAESVIGICEGELDALVSSVAGLPAVGIPGSNNFKPHYYRLFQDFERVFILGDGDAAGRKFAAELARDLPTGEAKVMPAGRDVSEFVQEAGVKAFLEYVMS